MILSIIKAALASVHGVDKIEKELSGYYLADEIEGTYRGMQIAISEKEWAVYREYSMTKFINLLKKLAEILNLSAFLKHPRGPKKAKPKRKSDPKHPHVSNARLLANRKK